MRGSWRWRGLRRRGWKWGLWRTSRHIAGGEKQDVHALLQDEARIFIEWRYLLLIESTSNLFKFISLGKFEDG